MGIIDKMGLMLKDITEVEAIKIYDKTENQRLIKIIIYIIILLLSWICLFYCIPLILNLRNKK